MSDKPDILRIIKNRKSIRVYEDRPVPKESLDKILEAGLWGPSIHHLQPWEFIIIEKSDLIKSISEIFVEKSKEINIPGFFSGPTIRSLTNAKSLICVYNTGEVTDFAKMVDKKYIENSAIAELSAIAAAIQNMILTAESLGIGSCWLDAPLFCGDEINELLEVNHRVVALISFGYPAEAGRRAPRKSKEETVRFIR